MKLLDPYRVKDGVRYEGEVMESDKGECMDSRLGEGYEQSRGGVKCMGQIYGEGLSQI